MNVFSQNIVYLSHLNFLSFFTHCCHNFGVVFKCVLHPYSSCSKTPNQSSSLLQRLEYHAPLSFEQALTMGRTGRLLPSPVLNGYKRSSNGFPGRHSDSDEEDWC